MLEVLIILAVLVGFFFLNKWIRAKNESTPKSDPDGGYRPGDGSGGEKPGPGQQT